MQGSTAAPCPQVGASGPRLQIVDGAPIKQGETHRYCVSAKGGRFTAVLVWTDYPASSSAGSNLVNDLDLVVRASGLNGSALLGNGGGFGDGADRTNNVEQIDMPLPAGDVSIEVCTTEGAMDEQQLGVLYWSKPT